MTTEGPTYHSCDERPLPGVRAFLRLDTRGPEWTDADALLARLLRPAEMVSRPLERRRV